MCSSDLDTFGPIAIPGLAGERYFIVLVCQFTRWGVVRAFTSLNEVPSLVEEMLSEVRVKLNANSEGPKDPEEVSIRLHTDNASVFKSKDHVARMAKLKVSLHFASPYDARTNPFAERMGGVLIGMTRALLLEGAFPAKFWSVIIRTAQLTLNRLVRANGKSPVEQFTGGDIDFSNVYPTGTLCYWAIPKKLRDDPKLGNAASVGVYLGPGDAFNTRGHMVFTANEHMTAVSHVLIDEDTKPFQLGMLKELLKIGRAHV